MKGADAVFGSKNVAVVVPVTDPSRLAKYPWNGVSGGGGVGAQCGPRHRPVDRSDHSESRTTAPSRAAKRSKAAPGDSLSRLCRQLDIMLRTQPSSIRNTSQIHIILDIGWKVAAR